MSAVQFKQVSKAYGDCVSNHDLSFEVKKASLHGLIGENGAGKSTAMKALYGMIAIDSGEIWIHGKKVILKNPIQAMKCGVGMVHQHFMLAPTETVLDNLILGREPGFLWISRERAQAELEAISNQYGLNFNRWNDLVSGLSVGEQQRVEILKLLYQKSDILILDEPTAVLTPQEVVGLFKNLKRLNEEGKTIILISHKLKEVLQFTDSVTVMRRGTAISTLSTKDASEDSLAQLMVGREVSFKHEGERKMFANAGSQASRLRVTNLSVTGGSENVSKVSFALKPGEILGVAGVQGNGQSELLRVLSNPVKYLGRLHGEIEINGRDVTGHSPTELRNSGVGLVPEDRLSEGLLLNQDMGGNFLLGQQEDPRYQKLGFINFKKMRAVTEAKIKEYDIRPTDTRTALRRMSGGNQQKLVIARALDSDPSILFFAHPTRGVDVGAIEKIHDSIMKQRNQGKAVLLFSSELDELMDLSDRLIVFYNGEIKAEFSRSEFDAWAIGKVMGGGEK